VAPKKRREIVKRCKSNRLSIIGMISDIVCHFISAWLIQELLSYTWAMVLFFQSLPSFTWVAVAFAFLPVVTAVPDEGHFSTLSFKVFSQFVQENFSSRITLAQVLLVLFTMTDNPDLLSLHA
jgi:hypothetical protein